MESMLSKSCYHTVNNNNKTIHKQFRRHARVNLVRLDCLLCTGNRFNITGQRFNITGQQFNITCH